MKKLLTPSYYKWNIKGYKNYIKKDRKINAVFRGSEELHKEYRKSLEWRTIREYRKYQANKETIWGYYYHKKLKRLSEKTGIDFEGNVTIGEGMIIGHWGRIIVNGDAKIGDNVFLTHGVTIGRDIRGKRAGVPTIGNRVCIRTNSTIVGNIVIGDDVLIAPNTFVNFDVPSHSIVVGNPATVHYRENATYGHIPEVDNNKR